MVSDRACISAGSSANEASHRDTRRHELLGARFLDEATLEQHLSRDRKYSVVRKFTDDKPRQSGRFSKFGMSRAQRPHVVAYECVQLHHTIRAGDVAKQCDGQRAADLTLRIRLFQQPRAIPRAPKLPLHQRSHRECANVH